jgi:hypothetical protein
MRILATSCLCLAAASLTGQTYLELPSTASPAGEGSNYSLVPLMQPATRMQMFFDSTEVGPLPFTATELAWRYDGPIPAVGAPGPFTITRLQIRIGVTSVAAPSAQFSANVTQPLTTVFDGAWSYLPDTGSQAPHPWGGPNGTLSFPFTAPVPLAVAPGQWLLVDVQMEGNNISNFGFSHAILDGWNTTGGVTAGSALSYGQGCGVSASAPAATASATGLFCPGGAHFLGGTNLGANAFVLGAFGLSDTTSFVPLPFTLPGTACTLLASPDVTFGAIADANGALTGAQAFALVLPPDPAIAGVVVYEQLASLVPAANPWGIVLSNAVAVTLGGWTPPGRGTWTVAHDTDANALYANSLKAFGLATRLRTL